MSPGLFTGTTKSGNERGHVRVHSTDLKSNTSNQDDLYEKSQVVAVGTALPTLGIPVNSQQAQVVVSRLIFTSVVSCHFKKILSFVCFCCAFHSLFNGPQ